MKLKGAKVVEVSLVQAGTLEPEQRFKKRDFLHKERG
jgi:hypothetical protein